MTLGLWIRIPLRIWIYAHVSSVFVVLYVVEAMRWAGPPVHGTPTVVYTIHSFRSYFVKTQQSDDHEEEERIKYGLFSAGS
jgi:hypothetical protein